jgi:hypothetical protein
MSRGSGGGGVRIAARRVHTHASDRAFSTRFGIRFAVLNIRNFHGSILSA